MTIPGGGDEQYHIVANLSLNAEEAEQQALRYQRLMQQVSGKQWRANATFSDQASDPARKMGQVLDQQTKPRQVQVSMRDAVSTSLKTAAGTWQKMATPVSLLLQLRDTATGAFKTAINEIHGLLNVPFVLTTMIAGGAGAEGLVNYPLQLAGNFEVAQANLKTFLGSSDLANQRLKDLQATANQTGYSFEGLTTANASLLQVGFSADQSRKYLDAMIQTAARRGQGMEEVNQLTQGFAFLGEQGYFGGRGVMQLVRAGLPVFEAFAQKLGGSALAARRILSDAALPLGQSLDFLADYISKHFSGAVENRMQTLPGLLDRIKQNFIVTPLLSWGEGLAKALEPRLQGVLSWLADQSDKTTGFFDSLRKFGESAGNWILGPLDTFFTTLGQTIASPAFASAPDFLSKMAVLLQTTTGIDPKKFSDTFTSLVDALQNIATVAGGVIGVFLELAKISEKSGAIENTATAVDDLSRAIATLSGTPKGATNLLDFFVSPIMTSFTAMLELVASLLNAVAATGMAALTSVGGFVALIKGGIPGFKAWNEELARMNAQGTGAGAQELKAWQEVARVLNKDRSGGTSIFPSAETPSPYGMTPDQAAATNPGAPIPPTAGAASIAAATQGGAAGASPWPANLPPPGASAPPPAAGAAATGQPPIGAARAGQPAAAAAASGLANRQPTTSTESGTDYHAISAAAAQAWGVDPNLLSAQVQQESGWHTGSVSGAGAIGIAQFIPETAAQYHLDPTDPVASLYAQAHYMHDLLVQYNGDVDTALIAYNGGPGGVARYKAGNPTAEGADYLRKIHGYMGYQAGGVITEPIFGIGASGKSYSFGEQGTEHVLTGDQLMSAMGGNGGGDYHEGDTTYHLNPTFHMPPSSMSNPEEFAAQAADAMLREIGRHARRFRRNGALGSPYAWSTR